MHKPNPVVHFEMPADDMERIKKFYSGTFGWNIQQMGQEFGNYVVVTTTESDQNGPNKPGAINGGFYMRKDASNPNMSVVIAVDDIKEHMKKVEDAGGKLITKEPQEIPGVGLWAVFEDTEGNKLSMLQPAPRGN